MHGAMTATRSDSIRGTEEMEGGLGPTVEIHGSIQRFLDWIVGKGDLHTLVAIVLLSIIILVLLYMISKKTVKLPKKKSYIGLSIAHWNKYKTIIVMQCESLMDDVKVLVDRAPSRMRVIGKLRPLLRFDWEATIVIKCLDLKQNIPNEVRVVRR